MVRQLARGEVRHNLNKQWGSRRVGVPRRQSCGKEAAQGLALLEGAHARCVWGGDIDHEVAGVAPQLPDADYVVLASTQEHVSGVSTQKNGFWNARTRLCAVNSMPFCCHQGTRKTRPDKTHPSCPGWRLARPPAL